MADDPKPDPKDDPKKDDPKELVDPDAGAKKALDTERAARRDAEKQLRDIEQKLKQIEDKDKSEVDKLRDDNAQLTKHLEAANTRADRYEVAVSKGLTAVMAKRLTGSTKEELETDADELISEFGGDEKGTSGPVNRPTENLRGGGDPTDEPTPDMRKVVADIPRGG